MGINELWDCGFGDGGFSDLSRGMDAESPDALGMLAVPHH